jgi:5'-methylthioadenosine phosphorylase
MALGIITGSGTYALPGFEQGESTAIDTPYGEVAVTRGSYAGVEVLHIARHGAGHARLSSAVNHRANVWALSELGASAVIGLTACGAVDPTLELGSLLIFDDLHFIANRLPDGSLCTFHMEPGDPARGHWVLHGGPYSPVMREILAESAAEIGAPFQSGGVYGHVDGPRFNTPVEIAALATAGVAAVSQTGGPETVLCGELELPFALVGFVTDYANEVQPGDPTPVATLVELIGRSPELFAELLAGALPRVAAAVAAGEIESAGTVLRFAEA